MPDNGETTTVTGLAEAIAAFRSGALSEVVVRQAELLILDTIGCAIAAEGEGTVAEVRRVATAVGGALQATAIGGAKTSVLNAVLVNGAMVRVLDLNDYNIATDGEEPEMGGHPSDNIVVALAVGEWKAASGREVIAAVVLGYEVFARLKDAITRMRQFDGSSVSGIVAPAMAGWLMGLDAGRLAHALAFGAARCMAPLLMRRGRISSAKSLSNALIAQSGVLAALLAAEGATGPLAVLDHPLGVRAMFTEDADLAAFTAPLSAPEAILGNHVKAYPCVGTGQAAVAAAIGLHRRLGDRIGDIERIDITMADYPYTRGHQTDPGRTNPTSRHAADHCFPFVVAAALMDGELTPRQFEGERWADPTIRDLMSRTEMGVDAALNERAPGGFPCRVRIALEGGDELMEEVLYPPGYSRDSLEEAVVVEKFNTFAGPVIGEARADEIKALVLGLDGLPSVEPLMTALSGALAPTT